MGHQFSKVEGDVGASSKSSSHHRQQPTIRNAALSKVFFDNDGLSRATEITDESITPPPSPGLGKLRHSESWIRGGGVGSSTTSCPMVDSRNHPGHGRLPRRDSDPGHPSKKALSLQPRTVPVKCPPRKRPTPASEIGAANAPGGTASHEDGLEASYLERMYDSRTWDMYRRITEARRQARTNYAPKASFSIPAMDSRKGRTGTLINGSLASDDTSEWENLRQEEEPAAGEEAQQHEMIFLFEF
ncbi:hypothetical protein IV203_012316 [Nitzschia inconspicua]|uniref:Uncharacterized protein n=1 Tax=Nitzschia inconspicua TaxID=303405 RepID=A0A9K3KUT0_9STRA|nr:hypothetical protein IV203_012316 [Nitzschia inconspicua]